MNIDFGEKGWPCEVKVTPFLVSVLIEEKEVQAGETVRRCDGDRAPWLSYVALVRNQF